MTKESSIKNPALGKLVASRRKARGLTLRDVARDAGIDIHTMSMLERGGYASPNPRTLKGISRALDIPLLQLFQAADYVTESDVLEMAEQVALVPVFSASQVAENERRISAFLEQHESEFLSHSEPAAGEA